MENKDDSKKYEEAAQRWQRANSEGRIVASKSAPFYGGDRIYLTQFQIERIVRKELHPKTLEEAIDRYRI